MEAVSKGSRRTEEGAEREGRKNRATSKRDRWEVRKKEESGRDIKV